MGRVAKYKKIKACDPFAKRKTKDRSGLMMSSFASSNSSMLLGGVLDPKRKASLKKRARRERNNPRKKKKNSGKDDVFDGFDLPPKADEENDFDLLDPALTVKVRKKRKLEDGLNGLSDGNTTSMEGILSKSVMPSKDNSKNSDEIKCHIPVSDKDEAKVARILNLDNGNGNDGGGEVDAMSTKNEAAQIIKDTRSPSFKQGRQEGESMTSFRKRVDRETREILLKSQQKPSLSVTNPEKAAKKKAYLQKRKLKKKGQKSRIRYGSDGNDDYDITDINKKDYEEDKFVTGARAIANTKVGITEQIERPPVFNVLPRGAKKKVASHQDNKNSGDKNKKGMNKEQEEKERRAMELMRDKVIASYAMLKAKRKKN